MYAVIKSGGKQYRVKQGQVIKVEKLPLKTGNAFDFNEVLLVANGDDQHIGAPFVKNAKVLAQVLGQGRGNKVEIIKFKRRKHHIKRQGHRQDFTEVKVTGVMIDGVKLEPQQVAKKAKKAVQKQASLHKKPPTKHKAIKKTAPKKDTKKPMKKVPAEKALAKKKPINKVPTKKLAAKKKK